MIYSSNNLIHFGVKGMHWGQHRRQSVSTSASRHNPVPRRPASPPQRFSGASEPRRPKEVGSNASREEQLVSRSLNQAYMRAVGPAMAVHVMNIPDHKQSSDPRVNELLNRVLTQSLNRVEEQAGRQFMSGLPAGR